MSKHAKYDVNRARPLALQGMPFVKICEVLNWPPRTATQVQNRLRHEGVLVGYHSDEYVRGKVRGRKEGVQAGAGATQAGSIQQAGASTFPQPNGGSTGAAPSYVLPQPSLPKGPTTYQDNFDEGRGTWDGYRVTDRVPQSLDDLIALFKVDTNVWQVGPWEVGGHEMGSIPRPVGSTAEGWANASTTPQITPLYKIKAKFIRVQGRSDAKEFVEGLVEKMQAHSPVYVPTVYIPRAVPGFMLEPAIYDTHLGKFAWAEESGQNYDLRIAETRYEDAMSDIIRSASVYDVDRICLPLGHDFFHVDTRENKTSHGTIVTADSRQQKVFQVGCDVIIRGIDRLRLIAPVDVVMVPGNHDLESNFSLGEVLKAWYRLDDCVQVDNRAAVRKYYEYGKVMLQLTHGSEETTAAKCHAIASSEEPEMWGRTLYRETHQGHRHKKQGIRQKVEYVKEYEEHLGFIARIISALSETDDWHFGKAFVSNLQGAESFIWSAERGLVNHHFYTVPEELRKA